MIPPSGSPGTGYAPWIIVSAVVTVVGGNLGADRDLCVYVRVSDLITYTDCVVHIAT